MMYARLKSWHILRPTSEDYQPRYRLTLCGRYITGDKPRSAELPLDEKSCETCLRLTVEKVQM